MKRTLPIILALLLALGLSACSVPTAQNTDSTALAATEDSAIVTFADPVLEAMVRAAMGRPNGDITAEEAAAVTAMNLDAQWQHNILEATPIRDISGLEYFKNLKNLNLNAHAVADISPLAKLTSLSFLSLAGNPVADISPLSGMSRLRGLTLSGCAATDYSPLSSLVNLEYLALDDSTITDLSALSGLSRLTHLSLAHTQTGNVLPLASLTSLTGLYLEGCPIDDYAPLTGIYTNLKEKDFTMASTLSELGFTRAENSVWASYTAGNLRVNINHSEWGIPEMDMEADTIRLSLDMDGGTGLTVGCDPAGHQNYVFSISQNGEHLTDYIYVSSEDNLMFNGDRKVVENAIRAMLGDTGSGDILLAPITAFNDTIRETFGMTADALFALPYEPTETPPGQTSESLSPPLERLGFIADTANAACLYEKNEPHYMRIAIHRPEWGETPDGWNIEFNDSDLNGYNLLIAYFADEDRYHIRIEKDGVDCSFDCYPATDDYGWEYPDIAAVIQMFGDAFDTQGKEAYLKPLPYFEQVVQDLFGMTIEKLYALPVGE